MYGPNKLEYYITLSWKFLPGTNAPTLVPFLSCKENEVLQIHPQSCNDKEKSFIAWNKNLVMLCCLLAQTFGNPLKFFFKV
jgi:hypothetical protein